MPIGNIYEAGYTIASVNYPVFTATTGPTLTPTTVAYKSLSVTIETRSTSTPLIQGWPLPKVTTIEPTTFVWRIELPVLLTTSTDKSVSSVRQNEINFFQWWLCYAMSTMDRFQVDGSNFPNNIEGTERLRNSAIVENASVNVTPDDITLSLTIRTNGWLHWVKQSSFNNVLMARKAKGYDTYVTFQDYTSGVIDLTKVIGWQNQFGVVSAKVDITTDYERLCTTPSTDSPSELTTSPSIHVVDQLNVYMVKCDSDLDLFGAGTANNSSSTQASGAFSKLPLSDPSPVFDSSTMSSGGLQLWLANSQQWLTNTTPPYTGNIPLVLIPTGMIVSSASDESAGSGTLHSKRHLVGVISKPPAINPPGGSPWTQAII